MTPTMPELRSAVAAATSEAERLAALLALESPLIDIDPQESLTVATAALELARRLRDEDGEAKSLLRLGKANLFMRNHQQALTQLEDARTLFERAGNVWGVMSATGNIGNFHQNLGNYSAAAEHFKIALSGAQECGAARDSAYWMMCLGSVYRVSEHPQALEYLQSALALAKEIGYDACAGECMDDIGSILYHRGDYAAALEHHHEALSLAEASGSHRASAQYTCRIGDVYEALGDYTSALRNYHSSLELMENLDDRNGIALATGSIGNIHYLLGENPRALECYQRAISLFEEMGQHADAAVWRINVGNVYECFAEYDLALEQYRIARAQMEAQGRRRLVSYCEGNIGDIYYQLGDYARALAQYQSALAVAEEYNDRYSIATWTRCIGHVNAAKDFEGYDPARAKEFLSRSIELAVECGHRVSLQEAHQWLSALYQQEGKWEAAHQHTVKFFEVKVELQNLEAHKKAQQFEYQRKIAEVEKLRAIEQAEAGAAMEIQSMKAKQTERELGNATLQLLAQTELLRDLRQDLLKIARKIPPTESAARELRDRVKKLPCEAVDWEKYDGQFKAVHPDFIRTLTERAPDLTATEVRICTMLRMNLKSHEIATLFCMTERGVEFHRVNIRQKLGLRKEEKLPIVLGAM